MPPTAKDPAISALEAVHDALKPLAAPERLRVLASVYALLGISDVPATSVNPSAATVTPLFESRSKSAPASAARPVAIRELIQQRKPRTHPEFITLFAYYREKHQNLPTFSRAALATYYPMSHEPPPGNFDRDFVKALKRGWIHEDGDNSYITSKGLEVVESNFSDAKEKAAAKTRPPKKTPPRKKKR